MEKECSCRLASGVPNENCYRCGGSGSYDVVNFQEPKTESLAEWSRRVRRQAESFDELARRAQGNREWEAGREERERSRQEQLRTFEEMLRVERLLDPSPNPGSPRYLEGKRVFAGRLYTCLKCGYDANLDPKIRCGMCWLFEGFSGPS